MPHKALFFIHLPKTGGTTLCRILEAQYGHSCHREDDYRNLANLQSADQAAIEAYTGHMPFGAQNQLSVPVDCFTMLRDPVKQAISHYKIVLEIGFPIGHYLNYDTAKFEPGLSPAEFFRSGYMPDNLQTRWLAGVEAMQLPFGECTPDVLSLAKSHMENAISLPGVTEKFDESVVLLQQRHQWAPPCYLRENVNARSRADQIALEEAIPEIEAQTLLDQDLYRFTVELLDAQIRDAGPHFTDDLRRFRIINRKFQMMREMVRRQPFRMVKDALSTERKVRMEKAAAAIFGKLTGRAAPPAAADRETIVGPK